MSGKLALRFRRLELRRTPGIQTHFTLDGLCDGINITYGPNASGKTTTALALQMLLWPDFDGWERASLAGHLELQGSQWHIEVDSGEVVCRQDGSPGARLPIDADEYRDRYVLTLHDLLQAEDADFAGIILRESSGGYDVEAARQELGYRARPSRPSGNIRRRNQARKRRQEALRAQHELLREQMQLSELREQLDAARRASGEAEVLRKALVAHAHRRDLKQAQETLELLPKGIARLRGDELERLDDIRARRDGYEDRRRQALADIEQAEAAIEAIGLDGVELPAGFAAQLRERGRKLQEHAGRLREAENAASEALKQRDHAAGQLGDGIDEARIRQLESSGLRDLLRLAQRLEQARREYEAAEALRGWLGDGGDYRDVERLQRGIAALNSWLRSGDAPVAASSSSTLVPAAVAAGLIALAALLAGIIGQPLLLALILFAPVPVVLALVMRPRTPRTGRAEYARQEYVALGLEQPRAWNVEQVTAQADRLGQELRRQQLEQERAQRWAALEARWQQATNEYREAYQAWTSECESLGIQPLEPAQLFLLAQNLDRWQQADARLAGARQLASDEREQFDALLAALNADLARAGYSPAADQESAQGYIDDLIDRVQRLREVRQKRDAAWRDLEQVIRPEIERLDRERARIFEQLSLPPDAEQTLSDWLEQRDEYLSAKRAVERAESALDQALTALGERADLAEREESELQDELESLTARAEEADELNRQIIEIETRVEQAKRAHDLERALAAEAAAVDVLRADREESYRLAAGWELADFVRRQTRDRDRPKVFHRARELFARMTRGRYVLQFADEPRPAFRAEDTTTKVIHELDELSSATRVQLLMAVRIAFVEEMEQGPMLPLILDETLGNADEHRAEAIIRAVCEICRTGRQVFYFTAQHDEVGKWRRLLADYSDLPHNVISLAEARQLPEFDEPSVLVDLQPTVLGVPGPNGADRLAYRQVLHVPEIDPRLDAAGAHLWYVVDDLDALHRLLSMGISTWGQLETLVEFGGDYVSSDVFERARARANILDAALRAYRVGRGRPVDRAAVLDSEAFTAAFIDRVIEQAEIVQGDAEVLLRRLDAGHVRRLRTDYIDAFRKYLLDEGYLDPEDPLSPGAIRARVYGEASGALQSGLISRDDVEFLLCYLPISDAGDPELVAPGSDEPEPDGVAQVRSGKDGIESDGVGSDEPEPAYRPRLPQVRVRRQD